MTDFQYHISLCHRSKDKIVVLKRPQAETAAKEKLKLRKLKR